MSRKFGSTIVSAALLLIAGFVLAAEPATLFVGTWKLNPAKSKFEGTPPLKSYTITITDAGGGKTHNLAQWVDADGTKGQIEYTTDPSGKPTPTTGDANDDSVMTKATGPRSLQMSFLKDGKKMEGGTYTVASDGKSLHAVESGTDAGIKYRYDLTFDRQ